MPSSPSSFIPSSTPNSALTPPTVPRPNPSHQVQGKPSPSSAAEATPVGFRESDQEGNLHWAGPFETPFGPGKMVVKGRHVLPISFPTLCSSPSPTGEYSFESSFLALTHLSSTPRLSSMAR
ncbi:hypothetical protein CF319_g8092, partial [Tilletia indica]